MCLYYIRLGMLMKEGSKILWGKFSIKRRCLLRKVQRKFLLGISKECHFKCLMDNNGLLDTLQVSSFLEGSRIQMDRFDKQNYQQRLLSLSIILQNIGSLSCYLLYYYRMNQEGSFEVQQIPSNRKIHLDKEDS
jgi:hypothetical protein